MNREGLSFVERQIPLRRSCHFVHQLGIVRGAGVVMVGEMETAVSFGCNQQRPKAKKIREQVVKYAIGVDCIMSAVVPQNRQCVLTVSNHNDRSNIHWNGMQSSDEKQDYADNRPIQNYVKQPREKKGPSLAQLPNLGKFLSLLLPLG